MIPIEDIIHALRIQHLIIEKQGELVLTNKLKRAWRKPIVLSKPSTEVGLVKVDNRPIVHTYTRSYKEVYKEFIKRADIPSLIDTGTFKYNANRYSKDAEKVFASIMKDDSINKDALLIATKLYYKRQDISRPMIGNYFTKGTWESVYDEFMASVQTGNVDEYIQKNLKEGNGEHKYEQGI